MFGMILEWHALTAFGYGILVYGVAYLFVHDIFIHQRVKWFKHTNIPYFKAIRRAHYKHHTHLGKEEGECFGMLWVSPSYIACCYTQRARCE